MGKAFFVDINQEYMKTSSERLKNKYKTFSSVIGTISIIIAIVLGFIELYKVLFAKEYDVEVVGKFHFYEINDSLYTGFDELIPKLDSIVMTSSELDRNMKIRNITTTFIDRLLNKMNNFDYNIPVNVGEGFANISSELYPKVDSINLSKFDYKIDCDKLKNSILKLKSDIFYSTYILKLKIVNNGNRELNNVNLKINSARGNFRVKEQEERVGELGYTDQISYFLENMELGTIEAKEIKYITVWVEKPIKREQIKFTHSGIMVDIDFEEFEM